MNYVIIQIADQISFEIYWVL